MTKKKLAVLAAALVFLSAGAAEAARKGAKQTAAIDRKEVVAVLEQMDKAMTERNAAAYMAQIDPSAEFHLNTPTSQGPQQMKFSYEEYRQMVSSSFADASSYQVHREGLTVTPLPEGKAMASDLLFENISMKGKETKTITSERMLFEKRGGSLKLTGFGGNVVSTTK